MSLDLWMAVRYVERNPVRAGLVSAAEDYAWSSARAHATGKDDPVLSPNRPYPGPVPDWLAWLSEPEDAGMTRALRVSTQTGRPWGALGFVEMLEGIVGRRLRPCKRGPQAKGSSAEAPGQQDALPSRAE